MPQQHHHTMNKAVSTAQRKLTLARKRYAEADALAGRLPTEGFNADKAMTPALEKRGIAQRAVWKAEDELKAAVTMAASSNL